MARCPYPQSVRLFALYWKTWVIIFTPLLLLPLPVLYQTKAIRCAYVLLLMAVYWVTEALPMAVTAMLPVALMPWLGVVSAKDLAGNYLKDTNMLFFGGLIVALAVEKWKLHQRIALRVLMLVGSQPKWLMFGFMSTTAFLSMWISNTATTAMMVPIAQAVLLQIEGCKSPGLLDKSVEAAAEEGEVETKLSSDVMPGPIESSNTAPLTKTSPKSLSTTNHHYADKRYFDNMAKGLTLCVAYAANIGGTATLTGTGPNLVIKGNLDALYGADCGINFSSWMVFAFPNALVSLLCAWIFLQLIFLGYRDVLSFCLKTEKRIDDTASVVIRKEYAALGPMSFAEGAVLVHFTLLALLWITREPEFVPGWASLFEKDYVTDACVAMFVALCLFIFPSQRPKLFCRSDTERHLTGPVPALLDWPTLQKNMNWSVILVLGGGFALADACQRSGLSAQLGTMLSGSTSIPDWLLIFLLSLFTAAVTEVTSNVATATILMPILAELSRALQVNPLYLMIPVTISCSFAFMLPVATPPNAIVFTYGRMKIWDMVRAGFFMNIICLLILMLSINTLGRAYFNLGTYPSWAHINITITTFKNASVC